MEAKTGQKKGRKAGAKDPETLQAVEAAVARSCGTQDAEYVRSMLVELVVNQAVPLELLDHVPVRAQEVGKTKFDQLYDACMALVFPSYLRDTLTRLLGQIPKQDVKIWRVILPEKFQITQVLLRAPTYQEAFGLACDYACRTSLRLYQKIPTDLTLRVMFMSEKALRRYLDIRWSNRMNKRKVLQLEGHEFTHKQINGARLAALGHSGDPRFKIARYVEALDLKRVKDSKKMIRVSAVETESVRRT